MSCLSTHTPAVLKRFGMMAIINTVLHPIAHSCREATARTNMFSSRLRKHMVGAVKAREMDGCGRKPQETYQICFLQQPGYKSRLRDSVSFLAHITQITGMCQIRF